MEKFSELRGSSLSPVAAFLERFQALLGKFLGLRFRVQKGWHAGHSLETGNRQVIIGSDANDDLVLFADELEQSHFSVSRPSFLSTKVRVSALKGGVTLGGEDYLAKGQWAERKLPIDIQAAGVDIQVAGSSNLIANSPIYALCGLALLLIVSLAEQVGQRMIPLLDSTDPSKSEAPDEERQTNAGGKLGSDGSEIVRQLRTKLSVLGLRNTVNLVTSNDGTVIATGEVRTEQMADWRAFLQWFDTLPITANLVNSVKKTQDTKPAEKKLGIPSVALVWFENGTVSAEMSDGSKISAGSNLEGGWKVKTIQENGMVLVRADQKYTLNF